MELASFFGMRSFVGIGLAFGLVLLGGLLFVLPPGKRVHALTPIGLYLAHVVLVVLGWVVPAEAVASKPISVLSAFFLLVSSARAGFLLVAEGVFEARLRRPIPKIFRDIAQAIIYVAVGMITLRVAGVEPGSLLTTSALLTAVIGLSLQDTLGNLFAGLSIQMQHPFSVGDWIQFDNDTKLAGQVIEINWRATKVVIHDQVEVIIPNSFLARTPIRNYTQPTAASRRMIDVSCSYDVAPRRVRAAILDSLDGVSGVMSDPAPVVLPAHFGASSIDYSVRFFTTEYHRRDSIDAAVRERIWYALRRARIPIPHPIRDVHLYQVSSEEQLRLRDARQADIARRLHAIDFLDVLAPETLYRLAGLVESREYASGEMVVRQGDAGDEMFLIVRGEVCVLVGREGGSLAEMARLGEGSFFGEMSLMTGESRVATVQVLQDAELLAIGREAFLAALSSAPEVATQVTHVIAARQEQLETHLAERAARSKDEVIEERAGALLERMKSFFQI